MTISCELDLIFIYYNTFICNECTKQMHKTTDNTSNSDSLRGYGAI